MLRKFEPGHLYVILKTLNEQKHAGDDEKGLGKKPCINKMLVKVNFKGMLEKWVGTAAAEFDLPANATYGELLAQIGNRFQKQMHKGVWDSKQNTFTRFVIGLIQETGERLTDHNRKLKPDETVNFFVMMVGG
jgi:molybdopterin converting factor small subunit